MYDNTFNLVVVNLDTPLPDDFTVQLEEYEGFSFEERIVEALSKMVEMRGQMESPWRSQGAIFPKRSRMPSTRRPCSS